MSAFIVDREDIDTLVTALSLQGVIDGGALDSTGRMLWAENLESLKYRYPNDGDGERPGPCDFRDSDVDTYVYEPAPAGFDAAQVAEIARCYIYQSCEHPGWAASVANSVVESLTRIAR